MAGQTKVWSLQNTDGAGLDPVASSVTTRLFCVQQSTVAAGTAGDWKTMYLDATRQYQVYHPGLKVAAAANPLVPWSTPIKLRFTEAEPDITVALGADTAANVMWLQPGQSYEPPLGTRYISFQAADATTLIYFFVLNQSRGGFSGTNF